MNTLLVIFAILVVYSYGHTIFSKEGKNNNLKNINIPLKKWSKGYKEIVSNTINYLENEGKKFMLLGSKGGYENILLEGQIYSIKHKVTSVKGMPTQVVQLIPVPIEEKI